MKSVPSLHPARLRQMLGMWAVSFFVASGAGGATPSVDENELLKLGFKVLVATNQVQESWVKGLPPGEIRPMQRTGKKFFIYPDASKHQIYVGGPKEYEAYRQLHPENGQAGAQEAANRAYRLKQDSAMKSSMARDLSDPYLGVTWADLGW